MLQGGTSHAGYRHVQGKAESRGLLLSRDLDTDASSTYLDDMAQLPDDVRTRIDELDAYLGTAIEAGRPLEALVAIRAVGDVSTRRAREAAQAAADGAWSWKDVGDALGVSKQAAHQKLSRRLDEKREQLALREREGHAKVARAFAEAREKIAQHPHAADRREELERRIDERERKRHEALDRRMQATRERLDRREREAHEKLDRRDG
jgi:hypothetical protein